MKILSIIAQKPDHTGSGVYCREIINCFYELGYEQALVYGIEKNEEMNFFDGKNIGLYPEFFGSNEMPFNVVGMSDEMPYKSTKYSDLLTDKEKLNVWINCFSEKIKEVYDSVDDSSKLSDIQKRNLETAQLWAQIQKQSVIDKTIKKVRSWTIVGFFVVFGFQWSMTIFTIQKKYQH